MVLLIKWFGRFGNALIQLKNAILIGLYYKHNIRLVPHSFFNTEYIQLWPEEEADQEEKVEEQFQYFYIHLVDWADPKCIQMNHEKLVEILQSVCKVHWSEMTPFDPNTVVIHVRSGDIFQPYPHFEYICPPLSYYLKILRENPHFTKIILLAEDGGNPCIDALRKRCLNKIQECRIGCDLNQDIEILMRARNVITSFGTFVPLILLLTGWTENVYYTNYMKEKVLNHFHLPTPGNTHFLECRQFFKLIGSWKYTPTQLHLLMKYPL
jgi:hypothetical protein